VLLDVLHHGAEPPPRQHSVPPALQPAGRREVPEQEVTRGFCHASVPELIAACQGFIERINRDPIALVDRLWPKFELDPEFEAKLRVPT
jgi:hypothetical protein